MADDDGRRPAWAGGHRFSESSGPEKGARPRCPRSGDGSALAAVIMAGHG